MKYFVFCLFALTLSCSSVVYADDEFADKPVRETQLDQVMSETLNIIFSGQERLHYSISWSGGVKIGDLYLNIEKVQSDEFQIKTRVKDYGVFELFYPVDDHFTTNVRGEMKLPFEYDVLQQEGRSRSTKRHYRYDQKNLKVEYKKNDNPVKHFSMEGTSYNEYSAFFITRALNFKDAGKGIVIPAFVDKKRHEVVVSQVGRKQFKDSLFGQVDTIKVKPAMSFKGLYNKDGDTIIHLSDDKCRVPILIQSKIVIGSLRADLVGYQNPACTLQKYQPKPDKQ